MMAIWEGSSATDGAVFSANATAKMTPRAMVGMRTSRVERSVVAIRRPAPVALDAEDHAAMSCMGQMAMKSSVITMAMMPSTPMYIQRGMFSPLATMLTATKPKDAISSSQASDTSRVSGYWS